MATRFRTYLATEVIYGKRTVSYRSLARALKVHVNAAKCMLYEFHEHENKNKPGSVYATYILNGVKKGQNGQSATNGHANSALVDDKSMPPSTPPPFTRSMLEPSQGERSEEQEEKTQVNTRTKTHVREDALEEVKEDYEIITSIHLYSVSPHRIQDLGALTDIGRGIFSDTFVKEDPLAYNKTYGVILNPEVRRRKGKRPAIVEVAAPKFRPVKDEPKSSLASSMARMSNGAAAKKDDSSRPGSSGSTTSASSTKQPNLKRDASDLFKSFAKTKTKPKLGREDTGTSASGTDTKMTDLDDEGESEDDAVFLDTNTKKAGTSKKRGSDAVKEQADKAAKLRRMMDSDDEDEEAVTNVVKASEERDTTPVREDGTDDAEMADKNDVAWSDSDTETTRRKAPGNEGSAQQEEDRVTAEPKRRRGKRKVMKKRTMKDEDGYLVTTEEAVWESFSEEEPEAKKPESSFPLSSAKTSSQTKSTAGTGKPAAKTGAKGASIMNFFGKK